MSDSPATPYLSIVITARNDNHGENMLRRLQTFINALTSQAKLHQLPMELLLVEWNPPAGSVPLADVLRWPDPPGPCAVRIITVPPEVHARYAHAEALPLYQMIAKNAGIRRARGEYILSTNIDILLSQELMLYFAERRLEPGRMYRIDRYDAAAEVPVEASVEDRLAWCGSHLLRLNSRKGTFDITAGSAPSSDGFAAGSEAQDFSFGSGWAAPVQHFGRRFRVASPGAEIRFRSTESKRILRLDLEPVGNSADAALVLSTHDEGWGGQVPLKRRTIVRTTVPAGTTSLILSSGMTGNSTGRRITFRVFGCEWERPRGDQDSPTIGAEPAPWRPFTRVSALLKASGAFASLLWRGKHSGSAGLPTPGFVRRHLRMDQNGIAICFGSPAENAEEALRTPIDNPPDLLHTNACGDFTLAHRSHWMELRGYPEFDLFSMNIDSLFCYTAHYGGAPEFVLRDPMRIYHIEHSTGSGWTPEGEKLMYQRLIARGIPWLPSAVVLRLASAMKSLKTTMIFNFGNWGLGDVTLPEASPVPQEGPSR